MKKSDMHENLMRRYGAALTLALNYRDGDTYLHSSRVVYLAQELGHNLELAPEQLEALWITSIFHDIGKIGIPDDILKKPGKLNPAEWSVMQSHAAISGEIVSKMGAPGAAEFSSITRHHHEFFNGQGYPDGLKGEEIPYLSRVISIADCYDAMTSDREYRVGMQHDTVIELMKNEVWKKFDPEISSVFFQMIENSRYKAAV